MANHYFHVIHDAMSTFCIRNRDTRNYVKKQLLKRLGQKIAEKTSSSSKNSQ